MIYLEPDRIVSNETDVAENARLLLRGMNEIWNEFVVANIGILDPKLKFFGIVSLAGVCDILGHSQTAFA